MTKLITVSGLDDTIKFLNRLELKIPNIGRRVAKELTKTIHRRMIQLLNLGFYHDNNPSLRSQIQMNMGRDYAEIYGPEIAHVVDEGASGPYDIYPVNKRALKFTAKKRMGRKGVASNVVFASHVRHPDMKKGRPTLGFISRAVTLAVNRDLPKIMERFEGDFE